MKHVMDTLATYRSHHAPDGQGLLEVIVALGIIVAGVLGTTSVIVATVRAGRAGAERLTAMNLAREGIEIVRNMRDSNWMTPGQSWFTDIAGEITNNYVAVPVVPPSNDPTQSHKLLFAPTSWTWSDIQCGGAACSLVTSLNGEFIQGVDGGGNGTNFYRLLTLNPICWDGESENIQTSTFEGNTAADDCTLGTEVGIRVLSEVRWPDNSSGAHSVILEDRLYDWKES